MTSAHHLLFAESAWESHFAGRRLRQDPSLIIPMDDEVHGILHKEVITVPLPDHYTIMAANREYTPTRRYSRNIHRLMEAIDTVIQRPKYNQLQRDLGRLTITALEQQIPLIRNGQLTDYVGGSF